MSKEPASSESKTIDLVVDHRLTGVTPEMIDWWWGNIDTTERYKLWHPNDHKSFEWEVPPKRGHFGAIHRVDEDIGGITTTLRIRWEDPSTSPIPVEFDHTVAASVLDDNDNPTSWVLHEYEPIENGTKLRSTFRLPAIVPKQFIEALRKHNIEEIGEFANFLPSLFEEHKNI